MDDIYSFTIMKTNVVVNDEVEPQMRIIKTYASTVSSSAASSIYSSLAIDHSLKLCS